MDPTDRALLLVDALINLALGVILLAFPLGIGNILGLPAEAPPFYASLLGAVIFGIGIALLLARTGRPGLGLDGAIAINLSGAGVLAIWLVLRPPAVPTRGLVVLWAIVVLVLGVGFVELGHRSRTGLRRHAVHGSGGFPRGRGPNHDKGGSS